MRSYKVMQASSGSRFPEQVGCWSALPERVEVTWELAQTLTFPGYTFHEEKTEQD